MKKRNTFIAAFIFIFSLISANSAPASDLHEPQMQHHHGMVHGPNLTEPGNDAFGTIQEVMRKLQADPKTDWSRVNLEALRQHLIDMSNFTLNVDVVRQHNIEGGVELEIKPSNASAAQSVARVMAAHPRQVQQEAGWRMDVQKMPAGYRLRVTSPRTGDAVKIRALGYIGIMALGDHHPAHHWAMAIGQNPH